MVDKFLIVAGAPKCGTTSIASALASRPDMVVGAQKEPRFFTDFGSRRWSGPGSKHFLDTMISDERDYFRNFDGKRTAEWAIDASTDYLWCEASAELIARWRERFPVKVICITRDPVERAISEYQHTVRDGIETLGFRGSLAAEGRRQAAGHHPLFYHARRSRYAADLRRLRRTLGDDVLTLDYHEMKDFPAFVARVERFMGVPSAESAHEARRENTSFVYRAAWMQKLLRSRTTRLMARRIFPERLRSQLRSSAERAMQKPFSPDDADLADIRDRLADEIATCRDDPTIPTANWPSADRPEARARTAARG